MVGSSLLVVKNYDRVGLERDSWVTVGKGTRSMELSSAASRAYLGMESDDISERSSNSGSSCLSTYVKIQDLCTGWRNSLWKGRPLPVLLWINALVFTVVFSSEILVFETSTREARHCTHATAFFPLYISHAAGFAFACKWEGSVIGANLAGFLGGRVYISRRVGYLMLDVKLMYLVILSLIGTLEVQVTAHLVRRKLCLGGRKAVPTIDSGHDALCYFIIVLLVPLLFETLIALVECIDGMIAWSTFPMLWSTWSLGVLAALLTIAPAMIHLLDYRPRYNSLLRSSKILEFVILVVFTVFVLCLVIFSVPLTTVIRPLPYLLYPLLIFSVFRFNRLGWAVVVATISYFCSWGSVHYRSSALYYTSGSVGQSSPRLILQIELFMSVLGVVAISLAAAVREKKQLTTDLHNMNQRLEAAVRKRTQELLKANRELQISQTNAEKANLAKSEFLANMSHEIRTPIHGILGLTALLLQSELSNDQLESLTSVKDCADLLLHIINSILDLAKIEAGRLEVEHVSFSIRKVVCSSLRMLQPRAKERGLSLLWDVDSDVPLLVEGDPGKLQQCLLNLVGNALKFTHQGSVMVHISVDKTGCNSSIPSSQHHDIVSPLKIRSVGSRLRSWASWPSSGLKVGFDEDTGSLNALEVSDTCIRESALSHNKTSPPRDIEARASEQQKSEIQEIERNTQILFQVHDTGIGISTENVEEMFNPFTQADASRSRLYGGTGLGLCIVQRFVELLGGKIWVESEAGSGSTFSFVLPLRIVSLEENLKKRGSQQSQFEILPSLKKSTELRKRHSLQDRHLGKERRAHSLSALMKNLKFSPSFLVNDGEVEPLLQMTLSRDTVCSQRALSSSSGPSGFQGRKVNVDNQCNSMQAVTRLGWNVTTEKLSSISSTNGQYKISRGNTPTSSLDVNTCTSQDPRKDQLLTPLFSQCKDNFALGTDATGQQTKSHDLRLAIHLDKDNAGERSNSYFPTTTEAWDLELGIVDTRHQRYESKAEIVTLCQGLDSKRLVQPGSPATREIMLVADDTSRHRELHSKGRQWQPLLSRKQNLHVLLVEDNLVNQKVASRQLQRHGHTVTIVGDGCQALDVVRANHDAFDLILMDIQMPMMDGLEATDKIRSEEAKQGWRRLPILGLTAHAIQGYQDTCLSSGMDAYLGKPFDINQLLEIVQKLCMANSS